MNRRLYRHSNSLTTKKFAMTTHQLASIDKPEGTFRLSFKSLMRKDLAPWARFELATLRLTALCLI